MCLFPHSIGLSAHTCNIPIKKTVFAAEQKREDVKEARAQWVALLPTLHADKLVFLDETGAATDMARRYGRSAKGTRCIDYTPAGHWKTTTFIAGLRHDQIVAPWVLDAPMTGEAFKVYLQTQLVPSLKPGDIVICDNLPAHKVAGVKEIIESAGATIMYLPPYSPDFNPIEQVFAKLKALLRKAAERSVDKLWRVIGKLLNTFTQKECENYLQNSGYVSN